MADFLTIGEVAENLKIEPHVIRYWETKFNQIKPLKRRGGRRYYGPVEIENIERVRNLLHINGYTIRGARKALNQAFMAKSAKPDTNTLDMFGFEPQPPQPNVEPIKKVSAQPQGTSKEREVMAKVLESLREIQKLASS